MKNLGLRSLLKPICYGICLLLVFGAGWQIANKSWDGALYVYVNPSPQGMSARNIASVKKGIKKIPAHTKKESPQKTVVLSAEIAHTKEQIQIVLGHPLSNSTNKPTLACQEYQKIDMIWIASEVSFHGHAPKLSMKADCRFDVDNPSLIGPFMIPREQIITAPLSQKLFRNKKGDILLFSHVHLRWPKKWFLSQLSFVDGKKQKQVINFTGPKEEDFLTLKLL